MTYFKGKNCVKIVNTKMRLVITHYWSLYWSIQYNLEINKRSINSFKTTVLEEATVSWVSILFLFCVCTFLPSLDDYIYTRWLQSSYLYGTIETPGTLKEDISSRRNLFPAAVSSSSWETNQHGGWQPTQIPKLSNVFLTERAALGYLTRCARFRNDGCWLTTRLFHMPVKMHHL